MNLIGLPRGRNSGGWEFPVGSFGIDHALEAPDLISKSTENLGVTTLGDFNSEC